VIYDRAFARPRPLSTWIRGTVRLTFRDGATASVQMSQAEARNLIALVRADKESDELAWSSLSWIVVRSACVDLLEFEPAPDLGWPMTAEQRDRMRSNGFERGPLYALRDMWLQEPEPSFSANALRLLHASACIDPPEVFEELAGDLEGEAGAVYARQIWDDAVDGDGPDHGVDDAWGPPESPPDAGGRVG
jgi:hypothetical protein